MSGKESGFLKILYIAVIQQKMTVKNISQTNKT